jgi:hypothetical protein
VRAESIPCRRSPFRKECFVKVNGVTLQPVEKVERHQAVAEEDNQAAKDRGGGQAGDDGSLSS